MSEAEELRLHRLPMGGVFASKRPMQVSTLLGSCVAACLWDPEIRVGGMNHIQLPGRMQPGDDGLATRYGVHAMELLINRIMKLGGRKEALHAKLFGGARMLGLSPGMIDIPEMNCSFTLKFLATEGITVEAFRLGGTQAMSVIFETATGKALVRCVPRTQDNKLMADEEAYETRIYRASHRKHPGGVSLFE
ncbi:MAG TPA: chemotaxis protein CheD [Terriglobales bacterium]|nr:chemotaxis protein CheD [Terriglobales bacterium]